MHRQSGTYSGPSTEAALQKAAAELGVPVTDIDHEILLGSDAEGHVLLRATPRATTTPLADLVSRMVQLMGYDVAVKATPQGPNLRLDLQGADAGALAEESLAPSVVHLVKRLAEKADPGRKVEVEIADDGGVSRDEELMKLAMLAADRCRRYGRPVALPPMNPYERRLMHMAVRENTELATESLGSGHERRVVVLPEGVEMEGGGGEP